MEVTLAERLVTGAQGPGEGLLSADVELPKTRWPSSRSTQRPELTPTYEHRAGDRQTETNRSRPTTHPRRPTMEETIHGTTMPVLELSLADGESIVSEAGEFSWMSDAVQMATNTGGGMGGKGIMGAVKRAVSGASFMMTTYTAQGGAGSIAFASKVPGHILPIDVAPGNEFMVHRHGFMAATPGIELSHGIPAVVPGRHLRRRGLHPAEDRRHRPRLRRPLGRGDRLRPRPRPDDARAPRPRRPVPGLGAVHDAEGAGPGQPLHGLGRPPLRRADRPGPHLAAVDADRRSWPASSASTCPTATTTTAPRAWRPASGAPRSSATCSSSSVRPPDRSGRRARRAARLQVRLMALGGTVSVTPLP